MSAQIWLFICESICILLWKIHTRWGWRWHWWRACDSLTLPTYVLHQCPSRFGSSASRFDSYRWVLQGLRFKYFCNTFFLGNMSNITYSIVMCNIQEILDFLKPHLPTVISILLMLPLSQAPNSGWCPNLAIFVRLWCIWRRCQIIQWPERACVMFQCTLMYTVIHWYKLLGHWNYLTPKLIWTKYLAKTNVTLLKIQPKIPRWITCLAAYICMNWSKATSKVYWCLAALVWQGHVVKEWCKRAFAALTGQARSLKLWWSNKI